VPASPRSTEVWCLGRGQAAGLPGRCVPQLCCLPAGALSPRAHLRDGKEHRAGQLLGSGIRVSVHGERSAPGWGPLCGLRVWAGGPGFELGSDPPVRWVLLTAPVRLQGVESENVNVVKRLFKIQNLNASTIRTVMVADCSRYDSPDLLLDYEEQLAASSTSPCPVFDLGSDSEEEEAKPKQTPEPAVQELPDEGGVTAEDGLQQFFDDIMEGRVRPAMTETELETKVAELFVRNRTKPPELNLLPTDSNSKTKYLIFTTGCLTYSPHQIGKAAV